MTTKAYLKPNKELLERYSKTIEFINKLGLNKDDKILDIGISNPFTTIMIDNGYNVVNSGKMDLDLYPEKINDNDIKIVTALEILEHLVSPFPLLKNLPGKKLIATVPLKLWFASAYKNPKDPWDCHYHEFEDWQFDWLLEKSGWKIIHREKWKAPSNKIGIRPFLRKITPRYYAVYAEREN
jgi:hypothetical protein